MNPKMVEYERRMAAAMGVLDDARMQMQMQMQTPADDTLGPPSGKAGPHPRASRHDPIPIHL